MIDATRSSINHVVLNTLSVKFIYSSLLSSTLAVVYSFIHLYIDNIHIYIYIYIYIYKYTYIYPYIQNVTEWCKPACFSKKQKLHF